MKVFEQSRTKKLGEKIYTIIDYKYWGRDKNFIYYQIKKNFLQVISDFFFIMCLIFYYNSEGYIITITMIYIIFFKLYFTIVKRQPFMRSLDSNYLLYYKIAAYLHWVVLFTSELSIARFRSQTLCALIIVINMLMIDLISTPSVLIEKKKASNYFGIRNTLAVHALVYAYNEKSIINNVRTFVKRSYFKKQYKRNRTSNLNSN